ncbi:MULTISPECIES: hypothetical protein [unclassified Frankia]|uniref:hypothetical protein n=1 Tax=unclassified Frankia TaxID=2632575 RepID=UPI001EF6A8F1|nr:MULTISPECIES: hypothetical protein [unclassified Frankia]
MSEQDRSPWGPPTERIADWSGETDAGGPQSRPTGEDRGHEQARRWRAERRAAMARTADPRWARSDDGPPPADCVAVAALDAWDVPNELASAGEHQLWGAPLGADARTAGGGPGLSRTLGGLVVLAAGAATALASFMTWATVSAFGLIEISVKGTDAEQYGATTLLFGVVSAVLGGTLMVRARSGLLWILAAVTGSMIVLMAMLDLFQLLRGTRPAGLDLGMSVRVGPGLWITLLGGFAVVGGSLFARFGSRRGRP